MHANKAKKSNWRWAPRLLNCAVTAAAIAVYLYSYYGSMYIY